MRALQGFALGAGIMGAAGATVALATDRVQGAAHDVRNEAARAGDEASMGKSDALVHNVDGYVRLGLGGVSLLSLPVSAAAALAGKGTVAMAALGVGLGAAGAGLLAGNGMRPSHNLNSAGNALNAWIHTAYRAQNPRVADRVPLAKAEAGAPKPKPSGDQLRAVDLPHLPGAPDMERARRDAQKTLDSIDFSKRDLVIWVPGTGGHDITGSWREGVATAFGDRASHSFVDYPAEWNVGPSAATGMETLRLVLAGIADRGGDHRVLLGGHSQGAWIIGDVMADPTIHAMVDRAILFGQPGMAATDYEHRRDPKVTEVSDPNDPITYEMLRQEEFVRGMDTATRDRLAAIPDMLKVAVNNPGHGAYFAAKELDPDRWNNDTDPHQYADAMADGARWLDTGRV